MKKRLKINAQTMQRMHKRTDVTLMGYAVMLFQATAMGLLIFKGGGFDWQAFAFAAGLPLLTYVLMRALPRIFHVDRLLLLLMLFLCSVSLVTLKGIARSPVTPRNQAVYMAVGLAGMVCGIVFIRKVKRPERWIALLMIGSLGLLALPLAIGSWNGGAKNWIVLGGGLNFQPSEFVKISLMLATSASLARRGGRRQTLITLGFAAALCALLLAERDLGALLLYFLTTVIVYFLATSNALVSLAGLGVGAGCAVAAYQMFGYVQKRVAIWKNPYLDPLDSGFQIIQAMSAIGSGGLLGSGLGLGLPRSIPLYHCDFIFAAICEEFGCVFAVCLLAVYVLIIMRGISIAMSAREGFHALTAFAIVSMLGLQTLLIVGGNIRLIPLTGVTLPFIATGGSSVVSCMIQMGLLLGISSLNAEKEEKDIARAEWLEGVDA